jgi:arylsulfatase A-like enzyme
MKKNTIILPLACLSITGLYAQSETQQQRPNIIFILADDLGWNDLGCTGSRYYESPHIDRIAAKGVNFRQGYAACQVSSPSRASILTGKFPARHGITNWIGEATGEAWRAMGR